MDVRPPVEKFSCEPIVDHPKVIVAHLNAEIWWAMRRHGVPPEARIVDRMVKHTGPEHWPEWLDVMLDNGARFRLMIAKKVVEGTKTEYELELWRLDPYPVSYIRDAR